MATIHAEKRDGIGKGVSRQLRREGRVPAVVYGAGRENINLSLEKKEWLTIFEKEGMYLRTRKQTLLIEGQDGETVLVRGVQRHPVTGFPVHVDFLRFDAGRMIIVMVPVRILDEAECPGIRGGGILQVVRRELEVRSRSGEIPSTVDISVKGLNLGGSIHIEDVIFPEGVEVSTEVNFTVVTIVNVKAEEPDASAAEGATPAK